MNLALALALALILTLTRCVLIHLDKAREFARQLACAEAEGGAVGQGGEGGEGGGGGGAELARRKFSKANDLSP